MSNPIRRLREEAKLTQKQAAELCGVYQQLWFSWESRAEMLDLKLNIIRKTAKALGTNYVGLLMERLKDKEQQ